MKKNAIWGCLVSIVGIFAGLFLLIGLEKISGAEFVSLTLGFAVIGLIITFSAEVQEFSIAGNGVKLKELRSEAEKTIEELKEARTELFRVLVRNNLSLGGSFMTSSDYEDQRVEPFCHLFRQIEKFDCVDNLKIDLYKTLRILLVRHYKYLKFIHKQEIGYDSGLDEIFSPQMLYIAYKDDLIHEIVRSKKNNTPAPDFDTEKKELFDLLEAYKKLYLIKIKLDQLEH